MPTYRTETTVAKGAYGFALRILALDDDRQGEDWSDVTSITLSGKDPNGDAFSWTGGTLINGGDGDNDEPQFQYVVADGDLDIVGTYTGDVVVAGSGFEIPLQDAFSIVVRALS